MEESSIRNLKQRAQVGFRLKGNLLKYPFTTHFNQRNQAIFRDPLGLNFLVNTSQHITISPNESSPLRLSIRYENIEKFSRFTVVCPANFRILIM